VDRQRIRAALEACAASRILVTHGTDTMVATALALSKIPDKTIVLTGALQPGRFADSDAAFNLGLAYGAVQLCSPGVYVVANGTVFPAHKVRKNLELNRFEPL
jgi:L-asparaginase